MAVLQQLLRLALQDGAFLEIGPTVELSGPGDWTSLFPIGVYVRPEKVQLGNGRIHEGMPYIRSRCFDRDGCV